MPLKLDLLPKKYDSKFLKICTTLIEGQFPNNSGYGFKNLYSPWYTDSTSIKTHNSVHPCFLIRDRFLSVTGARSHTVPETHIKLENTNSIKFFTVDATLNAESVQN
jgi:hypothetical protein